jgi:hypothetical protein
VAFAQRRAQGDTIMFKRKLLGALGALAVLGLGCGSNEPQEQPLRERDKEITNDQTIDEGLLIGTLAMAAGCGSDGKSDDCPYERPWKR